MVHAYLSMVQRVLQICRKQLPLRALKGEVAPDFSGLSLSSAESQTGSSLWMSCKLDLAH